MSKFRINDRKRLLMVTLMYVLLLALCFGPSMLLAYLFGLPCMAALVLARIIESDDDDWANVAGFLAFGLLVALWPLAVSMIAFLHFALSLIEPAPTKESQ